jgi:hypothetical protein
LLWIDTGHYDPLRQRTKLSVAKSQGNSGERSQDG